MNRIISITYPSTKFTYSATEKKEQRNERKYIGIVLTINDMNYFAPLSSFKEKHKRMPEMRDFIKIGSYAVINLNNMFPVPEGIYKYINFDSVEDFQYKKLLFEEYRIIRSKQDIILKNAITVYNHKLKNNNTALAKRCVDFKKLEILCKCYNEVNGKVN